MRTHLEIMNSDGWQAACGSWVATTSSHIENVDCERCLSWYAKHVVMTTTTSTPSPSGEPK